ncbi:MAG: NAD(P)H-hydrate dehydratase [Planctomycetia bacterium]
MTTERTAQRVSDQAVDEEAEPIVRPSHGASATRTATLPKLGPRHPNAHKGDFGRVLIVGGSRGLAGAAALAGKAALRGGAGLVTIACPAGSVGIIAGHDPCYMTLPLVEDAQGRLGAAAGATLLDWVADVVAFGPGAGVGDDLAELLESLMLVRRQPLVIDADGLNLLSGWPHLLPRLIERPGPTILTPHPGEFARLTGVSIAEIENDRLGSALDFAASYRSVVVLKGHETIITDGTRTAVNHTGNPGMATGGSGDVLTGLIAALVGQGMEPFDAAQLGVWLHGTAGDLAAAAGHMASLIATDLIDFFPAAFNAMEDHAS